jgi:hypothetical protein
MMFIAMSACESRIFKVKNFVCSGIAIRMAVIIAWSLVIIAWRVNLLQVQECNSRLVVHGFSKHRSQLKMPGATTGKSTKFHIEDPHILGATAK